MADEPERPQPGQLWEIYDVDDWGGFVNGAWPTKLVYVVAIVVERESNSTVKAIDIDFGRILHFREVCRARRVA